MLWFISVHFDLRLEALNADGVLGGVLVVPGPSVRDVSSNLKLSDSFSALCVSFLTQNLPQAQGRSEFAFHPTNSKGNNHTFPYKKHQVNPFTLSKAK